MEKSIIEKVEKLKTSYEKRLEDIEREIKFEMAEPDDIDNNLIIIRKLATRISYYQILGELMDILAKQ